MSTLNFKCSNIAECDTALNQQMIELDEGAEQLCPECKGKLTPWNKKKNSGETPRWWVWAAIAAVVLMAVGAGTYLLASGRLWLRAAGKSAEADTQASTTYPCGLEPAQPADVGRCSNT